jgi:predicted DNA-binding transcriptional regulator YafY
VVPIESIDDAYAMFLRLGADVEIIEPLELRSRMAATANGMAGLYDVIA